MLTDHDERETLCEPMTEAQSPAEVFRRACRDEDGSTLLRLLRDLAPRCRYSGRELASILGVSTRHLQRLFASRVQRCPQRLLKEERLLSAQQLLQTAASVKEVAYGLGFRQASQFSRDYKHHFGVRPSVVRNDATRLARCNSNSVSPALAREALGSSRLGPTKLGPYQLGPSKLSAPRSCLARTMSDVSCPSLNQP
jgi:AraC-like DNA-binding protein